MNRSVDASGMRDLMSQRDMHRSHLPDASIMSTTSKSVVGGAAGGTTVEDTVLLEVLIPVYARLEDREEVCRDLGISVLTGRGGVNGLSRKICVRLTDPADPFFLFELELLEDDYGLFKQRLELLVDFSGFPKYLVSMLNGVVNGVTPYVVCFVVDSRDAVRGTLRVLERTDFRTVEHISLVLLRQGDAGQKRYLAERFQYFERAYSRALEEHRVESAAAAANIEALKNEVASLEESGAAVREQLRVELARAEQSALATASQLREAHSSEVAQLRASFEAELRHAARKAEEVQQQLLQDVREKDRGMQEAQQRAATLESTLIKLQSKLRIAEDKCNEQAKELEGLRSSNHDLQDFRNHATRSLSDNELNYVKVQERLRSVSETLRSREEEVNSLREQYQKQDNYIRIITSQNEQLTERNKKNELSLSKAHHIIANQLKHMKGIKEREHMIRNQLNSQSALLQEKLATISRMKDELTSSAERIQSLQNKSAELRDQLGKTDAARVKLAQELKQSQDALIHLQRSTSVNGRHWSVMNAPIGSSSSNLGVGLSTSCGSTSYDIYKEFNKNASTTLRNGGLSNPYLSNDITVSSMTNHHSFVNGGENKQQNGKTENQNDIKEMQQKNSIHSVSNNKTHNLQKGTVVGTENGETKLFNTEEGLTLNGKQKRQPLDKTAINVALNHTSHAYASKSFFNDEVHKTELSTNTASFIGKGPAAATAASPSAYF
ncbi:Spindle assembly abnormal protein 6 [Trypanosoma melophagium]|uniref:Spindle assembly abnormal protein 6 n=1 Tax=Trypanosoma melophagium TaxID=715481 RepID=UPI003519E56E|nr:Spindle assembly abnormal protein 6 [Trypanosoma melophagium]